MIIGRKSEGFSFSSFALIVSDLGFSNDLCRYEFNCMDEFSDTNFYTKLERIETSINILWPRKKYISTNNIICMRCTVLKLAK